MVIENFFTVTMEIMAEGTALTIEYHVTVQKLNHLNNLAVGKANLSFQLRKLVNFSSYKARTIFLERKKGYEHASRPSEKILRLDLQEHQKTHSWKEGQMLCLPSISS